MNSMKYNLVRIIFSISIVMLIIREHSYAQTNTLESLDERLTQIELENVKNKIKFEMEFNTAFGHYDISNRDPNNTAGDYTGDDTDQRSRMASIFRLGANSMVSSKLGIYSQLEVNYRGNSEFLTGNFPDFSSGTQRKSIFVFLKRAYFDYHALPWLTLSMGRLPTTNGPPSNIRNNQPRRGTYPLASFSLPIDGIAASMKYKTGSTRYTWRTIYAPGGSPNEIEDQTYGTYQNMTSATTSLLVKDGLGLSSMFEVKNKSSFWKQLLFITQGTYYSIGGFQDSFFDNIDNGEGLPIGRYRLSSSGSKLSDFLIYATYLQFDQIQLPLLRRMKLYGGHTYTKIKRRGSILLSQASSPFSNLSETGFLSDDDVSGNRWMLGGNYTFRNQSFFGFEGMLSTQNSLPVSSFDDELNAVSAENGRDIHFYYGVPFGNFKSTARLGVHRLKQSSRIAGNQIKESSLRYDLIYLLFHFVI